MCTVIPWQCPFYCYVISYPQLLIFDPIKPLELATPFGNYLRVLAITFVKRKFAPKLAQVFHRLATQRKLVSISSAQSYGRARKAALKWLVLQPAPSLRLFAIPFGHPSQVCARKLTTETFDDLVNINTDLKGGGGGAILTTKLLLRKVSNYYNYFEG